MIQKNHAFNDKQLKIAKEQNFGTIFNILPPSSQLLFILGVLEATASTLFINRYKITLCV